MTRISNRVDWTMSARIARTELRRNWRRLTTDRRRLAAFGLGSLFLLPALGVGVRSAYRFGATVATTTFPLVDLLASALTVLAGLVAAMTALRTLETIGRVDGEEHVLLAAGPTAVSIATICVETLRYVLLFGVPVALLVTAFSVGAGSPATVVVGLLATLSGLCASVSVGYAAGLAGTNVVMRIPVPTWLKYVVGAVLLPVVFVAVSTTLIAMGNTESAETASLPPAAPLSSEYATLYFVGTPQQPSLDAAVLLAVVLVVAVVPASVLVSSKLASAVWFGTEASAVTASGPRLPARVGGRPTPLVVRTVVIRAVRHPQRLLHLIYPVLISVPSLLMLSRNAASDGAVAFAGCLVCGPWLAGAAFGLNPIGREGKTLATVLLTPNAPRRIVRGTIAAGLLVGAPIAAVGVIGTAGTIADGWGEAVATAGFAALLLAFSATAALAVGSLVPHFGDRSRGRGATSPAMPALGLHAVAVGAVGAIGFGWILEPSALRLLLSLADLPLPGATVAVTAAGVVVLVTIGAYVYAVRRFESYRLE